MCSRNSDGSNRDGQRETQKRVIQKKYKKKREKQPEELYTFVKRQRSTKRKKENKEMCWTMWNTTPTP